MLPLDEFENQIRILKKDGVEFIAPQQLERILKRSAAAPAKCALITLDDADASQYRYAFPVLKREQVPFALFVITGQVGSNDFQGIEMSSWQQIREMAASGLVTIGSHTHNQHTRDASGKPPFLRSEDMPAFSQDFQMSIGTIEKETGAKPQYFAYPYGFGTPETDDVLLRSGMRLIFSLRPGIERPGDPSFFVKRVLVTPRSWEVVAHWAKN
jgi:peptidoglycan/xylan/chitin deacetylase (PgdA/CDA1 family)